MFSMSNFLQAHKFFKELFEIISKNLVIFGTNLGYLSHLLHKVYKIANLISKLNFYKLIPYPMDNSLSGRRRPARQT